MPLLIYYNSSINLLLKKRERGRERVRGYGRGSRQWQSARSFESFREQGRRHSRQIDRCDAGVYKQSIPFFFANFPADWKHEQMWRYFKRFGRVLGMYCPSRRDKQGRRFGFVRFLDAKNARELENQMNDLWVGNFKLQVNQARFEREKYETRDQKVQRTNGGEKDGVNRRVEWRGIQTEKLVSYADIVKRGTGKVRAMGGNLVLLEGADQDEMKELVENGEDWLRQWFDELKPWTPTTVASERFTWIRCQGLRFMPGIKLRVKINGVVYNVKCTDEESSNNLLLMNSDFKYTLPSEEDEDDESCSVQSLKDAELVSDGHVNFQLEEIEVEDDDGAGANYVAGMNDMAKRNDVIAEPLLENSINGGNDAPITLRHQAERSITDLGNHNCNGNYNFSKEVEGKDQRVSPHDMIEENLNCNTQQSSSGIDRFGGLFGVNRVESSLEEGRTEGEAIIDVANELGSENEGDHSKENGLNIIDGPSGKGRNKKMELEKEKKMQFLPDPSKKVAGELISNGNILNYNNNVWLQRSRRDAKELWKQAKLMGVTGRENKEEIIQRLEDMEN
ncbi:hypothetical protein SLEP1_g55135 [Rubroshorea leprosula]|uniref:RRM domain-containing protein n=1 Tax=Rubroshorea leprosula TaxID=152421 RepID=A0AAV5MHN2_9ROSI|nr:hypothetical protein SLEP1_g55135 [Rubroshorea leprosula]